MQSVPAINLVCEHNSQDALRNRTTRCIVPGMPKRRNSQRELNRFRGTSINQLLMEIAKDFQRRALRKFVEQGYEGLQPAHTAVIGNLGLEGARLTDLARRATMTKQGMGQLVTEVERIGYVERVPDPTDHRAKIVRFSPRGRRLVFHAAKIGEQIQEEYARLIGRRRLKVLHDTLEDLSNGLRDGATPPLLSRPRRPARI